MTVTELLAKFANPELIQNLTVSEKLTAGLVTTVLGMGITFTALILLLFILTWMAKLNTPKTVVAETGPAEKKTVVAEEPEPFVDEQEIVAAITTSIAMTLQTSTSNIVIRNIERVDDSSPAWNRAGLVEQMNSRI